MVTPEDRGRLVAQAVLEDIAPRLVRGEGPVDVAALARLVAAQVRAAVDEDRGDLLRGER